MHKTPEITRLIHENSWIVLSFAFARPVVGRVIDDRFSGEWEYLYKSVYELAEIRADRALLEMATQLRVLDDEQEISEKLRRTGHPPLGTVFQADGEATDLYLRDMTNKVMHARSFEWNLTTPDEPTVICHPRDSDRWRQAEIRLIVMMGLVGSLMF